MVVSFDQYLRNQYSGGYGPAPVPQPTLTPEEELALQQEAYYSGQSAAPAPAPAPQPEPQPQYSSPSPQVYYDQQVAQGGTPYTPPPPSEYYDNGMGGAPQAQPYQTEGTPQFDAQLAYSDQNLLQVPTAPEQPPYTPQEEDALRQGAYYSGMTGQEAMQADVNRAEYNRNLAYNDLAAASPPLGEGRRETTFDNGRWQATPPPRQMSVNQLEQQYGGADAAYYQLIQQPQDGAREQARRDQMQIASPAPGDMRSTQRQVQDYVQTQQEAAQRTQAQQAATDTTIGGYLTGDRPQNAREAGIQAKVDAPRPAKIDMRSTQRQVQDYVQTQQQRAEVQKERDAIANEASDFGFGTYDPESERKQQEQIALIKLQQSGGGAGLRMIPGGLAEVPVDLPGFTISPENFGLYKIATDKANQTFYAGEEPVYKLDGNLVQRGLATLGALQGQLLNEQFSGWLESAEGKAALQARFSAGKADPNGLVNDWANSMGFWNSMWEMTKADPTIALEAIGGALGIGGRTLTELGVRAAARGVKGAVELQRVGKFVEAAGKGTELISDPVFNGVIPNLGKLMPGAGLTEAAVAKNAEQEARQAAESFLNSRNAPNVWTLPNGQPVVTSQPNTPNPVTGQPPQAGGGGWTWGQPRNPSPAPQSPSPSGTNAAAAPTTVTSPTTPQTPSIAPQPSVNPALQRRTVAGQGTTQTSQTPPTSQVSGNPAPGPQTAPPTQPGAGTAAQPQAAATRSARDTTPTLPTRSADQLPYLQIRPGQIGTSYATDADVPIGMLDNTQRGERRWRVGDVSANGVYRIDEAFMPDGSTRYYILGNVNPAQVNVSSQSRYLVSFGWDTTLEDAVENARYLVVSRQNDPNGAAWTPQSIMAQRDELARRGNARRAGGQPPINPNPASVNPNTPTSPQAGGGGAAAAPRNPGGGTTPPASGTQPQPAPQPGGGGSGSAAANPANPVPANPAPANPASPAGAVDFDPIPGGIGADSPGGRALQDLATMSDEDYNGRGVAIRRGMYPANDGSGGLLIQNLPANPTGAQQAAYDRYQWLVNERQKRGLSVTTSRQRRATASGTTPTNNRRQRVVNSPDESGAVPDATSDVEESFVENDLDNAIAAAMYPESNRGIKGRHLEDSDFNYIKLQIESPYGNIRSKSELDDLLASGAITENERTQLVLMMQRRNRYQLNAKVSELIKAERFKRFGVGARTAEDAAPDAGAVTPDVGAAVDVAPEPVAPAPAPATGTLAPEEVSALGLRPLPTTPVEVNGQTFYVQQEANGKYAPFRVTEYGPEHMFTPNGGYEDTVDEVVAAIREQTPASPEPTVDPASAPDPEPESSPDSVEYQDLTNQIAELERRYNSISPLDWIPRKELLEQIHLLTERRTTVQNRGVTPTDRPSAGLPVGERLSNLTDREGKEWAIIRMPNGSLSIGGKGGRIRVVYNPLVAKYDVAYFKPSSNAYGISGWKFEGELLDTEEQAVNLALNSNVASRIQMRADIGPTEWGRGVEGAPTATSPESTTPDANPVPEPVTPGAGAGGVTPDTSTTGENRYVVKREEIERAITVQRDGDGWAVFDLRPDGTTYRRNGRYATETKAREVVDKEVADLTRLADRFNQLDETDKRFLLDNAHPFYDRSDHYRDYGKTGIRGVTKDGDMIEGYVAPPSEDMLKSDLTGAKIRYYVTLPSSKKIAHPDEIGRIRGLNQRLKTLRGVGLADPNAMVPFNPEQPFSTRTIVRDFLTLQDGPTTVRQLVDIDGVRGTLTGDAERGQFSWDSRLLPKQQGNSVWRTLVQYQDAGRRNRGYRILELMDFGGKFTTMPNGETRYRTLDEAFAEVRKLLDRNGELEIPERWRGSTSESAAASTPSTLDANPVSKPVTPRAIADLDAPWGRDKDGNPIAWGRDEPEVVSAIATFDDAVRNGARWDVGPERDALEETLTRYGANKVNVATIATNAKFRIRFADQNTARATPDANPVPEPVTPQPQPQPQPSGRKPGQIVSAKRKAIDPASITGGVKTHRFPMDTGETRTLKLDTYGNYAAFNINPRLKTGWVVVDVTNSGPLGFPETVARPLIEDGSHIVDGRRTFKGGPTPFTQEPWTKNDAIQRAKELESSRLRDRESTQATQREVVQAIQSALLPGTKAVPNTRDGDYVIRMTSNNRAIGVLQRHGDQLGAFLPSAIGDYHQTEEKQIWQQLANRVGLASDYEVRASSENGWNNSFRRLPDLGTIEYNDAAHASATDALAPDANPVPEPAGGGMLPGMQEAARPVFGGGAEPSGLAGRGAQPLDLQPQIIGEAGRRQNEVLNGQADMFAGGTVQPQPSDRAGIVTLPLSALNIDEARFQYGQRTTKRGDDVYKLARNWDDGHYERGDLIQVWRDPGDGKYYVISGHHKTEALRLKYGATEPDRPVKLFIRDDLLTLEDAKDAAFKANERKEDTIYDKAAGLDFTYRRKLNERGLNEATMSAADFDEITREIDGSQQLLALARLPSQIQSLMEAAGANKEAERQLVRLGNLIGDEAGVARGKPVLSKADVLSVWNALMAKVASDGKAEPTAVQLKQLVTSLEDRLSQGTAPGMTNMFGGGMLGPIDGDIGASIVNNMRRMDEALSTASKAANKADKERKTLTDALALLNDPNLTIDRLRLRAATNPDSLDDTMRRLVNRFEEADRAKIAADEEVTRIRDEVNAPTDARSQSLYDLLNPEPGAEPPSSPPSTGPAPGQNSLFFRSPDPKARAREWNRKVTEIRVATGSGRAIPNVDAADAFLPTAKPGSWSEKLPGVILTDEEESLLGREITTASGRRMKIGDAAWMYRSQLATAQAFATKTGPLTAKEQKYVNTVIKRFHLDAGAQFNGYSDAMDLLKSPSTNDRLLNRIVAERIGLDTGITKGARKANGAFKETDLFGRFREPWTIMGKSPLRGIDAYLGFRRATALYSPYRGPAYILTQALGNAVTLGIARPSALGDYALNPVDWKRIYQRVDNHSVETAVDALRKQAGLPHSSSLHTANARDELGSGIQGFGNIATLGQGNRIRKAANVFDVAIRESLWHDVWMRDIGTNSAVFRDHVDDLFRRADTRVRGNGGTPFPINPDAIREAIDGLRGASGNATFGARDVQNALEALYDEAAATGAVMPPRSAWSNFADRAARDWKESLSALDKKAMKEVNRVAFSFDETVADSVLRRFFMFHYWTTRAGALYVQEGIKKPALAAAYFRMFEELQRENEQNRGPEWMTGFLKFMQTPAGYSAFWNPTSLLATATTFQNLDKEQRTPVVLDKDGKPITPETGPKNDGLTGLGRFVQNTTNDYFPINPIVSEMLAAAGLMGPKFSTPDVVGDSGYLNLTEKVVNAWRQRTDPNAEAAFIPDTRDALNWINRNITGKMEDAGLPVEQAAYKGTDTFKRTQLDSLLIDVISEENPRNGADFRDFLEENYPGTDPMSDDGYALYGEYLNSLLPSYGPGDPQYQEAFARYNEMQNAGLLSNEWPGPLNAVKNVLPGGVQDAIGALSRQWSPFQTVTSVVSQADRMASNKSGVDADGTPVTPGEQKYIDVLSGAVSQPAETRKRRENTDFLGRVPDTVVTPQERSIKEGYDQIKNGRLENESIVIDGTRYTKQQLAAMDYDQRKGLAKDWIDTTYGPAGWDAWESYYTKANEYYATNPDAAASAELKARMQEYPAGEAAFIRQMMRDNPGFADFMQEKIDSKGGNIEEAAFYAYSMDALDALRGDVTDLYTPAGEPSEYGIRVPNKDGVIETVDLTAANAARREADAAEREEKAGGGLEASLQQDFSTLGQIKAKLNAYDPSGGAWQTYLNNVVLPDGTSKPRLPKGIYDIVKGSFTGQDGKSYDYPMPGGYAAGYLGYLQTNPERVMSFEVWQRQERKRREAAGEIPKGGTTGEEAKPPAVTDPATLLGMKSDPNYFPGSPAQQQSGNGYGGVQMGGVASAQATAAPQPQMPAGNGYGGVQLGGGVAPKAATPAPTVMPAPTSVPQQAPAPNNGPQVKANVNNLNLRQGPDVNAPVLRLLPAGETMTVISRQGNWVNVRFADGSTGWVSAAYLDAA